jgi:hypothetical protein
MPEESLEKRVRILEKEVERLQAINEIQILVGKYAVLHTPKTFKTVPETLFALKQPDVSVEIAMWGVYVGAEQIKTLYDKLHDEPLVGTMFEHQFTTPMIRVAGDGQTAKGVWFSPGHETPIRDGKPQAFWCWGKYAADFIKEDGKWKIWHWHFYDTFMVPYGTSWVDVERPKGDMVAMDPRFAQYPPDRPTTFRSSYSKTGVREPIPACPEPYETWDGKSAA